MYLPDLTLKIQFLLAGCDEWVAIKHKEFSRCIYLSFSKCKDEIYVAWRSTRLIRKICYYSFSFRGGVTTLRTEERRAQVQKIRGAHQWVFQNFRNHLRPKSISFEQFGCNFSFSGRNASLPFSH